MQEWRPLIAKNDPDWQWRAQHAADSLLSTRRHQGSSFKDDVVLISMLVAAGITVLIYRHVGHIGFIEHLSQAARRYVLGGTAAISFIALMLLFSTRLFRMLTGLSLVVVCTGILFSLFLK